MTTRSRSFPLQGGLDLVSSMVDQDPGRAFTMKNFVPWFNGGYRRIPGYEKIEVWAESVTSDLPPVHFIETAQQTTWGNLRWDDNSEVLGVWRFENYVLAVKRAEVRMTSTDTSGSRFSAFMISDGTGFSNHRILYPSVIFFENGTEHGANLSYGDKLFLKSEATTSGHELRVIRTVRFEGAWDGSAEGYFVLSNFANLNTRRVTSEANIRLEDENNNVVANINNDYYEAYPDEHHGDGSYVGSIPYITYAQSQRGHPYQFVEYNFYGGSDTKAVYGIGGRNIAFEICKCEVDDLLPDDNAESATNYYNNPTHGDWHTDIEFVFIPIFLKGVTEQLADGGFQDKLFSDPPVHIEAHENHLFLAFKGGSLQTSVLGEPLVFRGELGSAEFGMGAEITGLKSIPGNVLIITTTEKTYGLYGKDESSWELRQIGDNVGAYENTLQNLGGTFALNSTGVVQHSRSEQFGDFVASSVSQLVNPYVHQYNNAEVVCSTVNRESNQYRVYFNDMTALVMYTPLGSIHEEERASVRRRTPRAQFGLIEYPVQMRQIYNCEDGNGKERVYFITDDRRHIYEDGVGTSFDGAAIDSSMRLTFANFGSLGLRKRFRKAQLEVHSSEAVDIDVSYVIDFNGDTENSGTFSEDSGNYWNAAAAEAVWTGQGKYNPQIKLTGRGENISFRFTHSSADTEPFVLQGLTLHYEPGRLTR